LTAGLGDYCSTNNGGTTYTHQSGAGSLWRSGNAEDTVEAVDTDATKLYVRLPLSTGATATTPNTSASYVFNSSVSTTTRAAEGEEDEELEEGRLVANSLLVLMDLLHKYHSYMAAFPFLAFDIASRMIELIDAYEGQTAAMVLGAGAVEKKTLSTITTQHLCVASQCVSFLNDFIPALQAHLTAAVNDGTVVDAACARRAPRDAVAVACALGLIPSSPALTAGGGSDGATSADAGVGVEKSKLFVENDWSRVQKNCRAHRNEFFSKMGSLVYRKVESLGSISVQKNQWSVGGNEWVMAMLREVARLMRALRPLLPPADMDGVVVPLIGMLSVMLREATVRIPVSAMDDRAAATSDVMLFKANVEKFGYDVLTCAKVTSVSAVMQGSETFTPVSSEEAVLSWFLPTPTASAPQRSTVTPK
jgi:vacuolar protein sorting-associated protein 54